ncbi:unnamed protein product [Sphenostylis stenocarpa]|uniref:Uncharacterized protein n=1 Tax=Sphenostylis stenocarpa TaxID=92480 RepID=A0AA86T0D1_9FABA|nr:unnamed protein product [Sphenostylis stenocarpa]
MQALDTDQPWLEQVTVACRVTSASIPNPVIVLIGKEDDTIIWLHSINPSTRR